MVAKPIVLDESGNPQWTRGDQWTNGQPWTVALRGPHPWQYASPPVHPAREVALLQYRIPAPAARERTVQWVCHVPASVAPWLDCGQPVHWNVSRFGEPFRVEYWRCRSTSEKKCKPCAGRHRRLVRRAAADGMRVPQGQAWFLTLTPPSHLGVHCFIKDCKQRPCRHRKCPCSPPGGIDLAVWNASASKRWARLLVLWERHYGERPDYFRAVEVQERGALHLHVPLRCKVRITVAQVRGLVMRAGFGHEVDLQELPPGSREIAKVATYVSKYVTKAVDARGDVPWSSMLPDDDGVVSRVHGTAATYRTWSQSKSWGPTLTRLRHLDRVRYLAQEAGRVPLEAAPPPAGPTPGPREAPAPDV